MKGLIVTHHTLHLRGFALTCLLVLIFCGLSGAMNTTQAQTRAYVTSCDNTVSVIDTATNTVIATIPVGLNPFGVAITPDGTRAYVVNHGADFEGSHGTVSVIDTA